MQLNELKTANKGEWSELYVLFKIFQDKLIPAANAELEPVSGKHYRFLKVFRKEVADNELEYNLEQENKVVIIDRHGEIIKVLDSTLISKKIHKIFQAIKDASSSTFTMQEIAELMDEYQINKVASNAHEKTDLLAILEDQTNISNHKMGFSIKSHVGGAPTLVNSSSQTNFLYEVNGFEGDIEAVNSIDTTTKVRDRLSAIYSQGGSIRFNQIPSHTFNSNLRFVDTQFPQILATMLLEFYSGNGNNMDVLCKLAAQKMALNVTEKEVEYKVKGFLRSSALGMVPSQEWDTNLHAYGGYIVVLNDGGLVCYSLLRDDDFRAYLFNNTKFDTPSTTRHNYGKLFEDEGELYINLNLQIRFKK